MTEISEAKIMIVDDEEDMLHLLERAVRADLGCEVTISPSASTALGIIEEAPYDVVLLDIRMPGMDGMEALERLKQRQKDLTIVMMSGHGTIDLAVEAMKIGAYDFLTKPFDLDKVMLTLGKAVERSLLLKRNKELQSRIREKEVFHELVAGSPAMIKTFEKINLFSKTNETVLITGPSGAGKDLASRAIHAAGPRADKPYIAVNCPNLPESILESELFGYKKGAFTNATSDKDGLFWEARGGTIYLDEIGDISIGLQTKLLRVLQEKEIRPLGANRPVKIDVRIIASTNQDLGKKMEEKLFREDLFYRLNVLALEMPPLKDRKEDIPLLVEHFLKKYCKEFNKDLKRLAPELDQLIKNHPWPGNVRELENIIRRAILLCNGDVIEPEDIEWSDKNDEQCLVSEDIRDLPYKKAKEVVLERFHHEYLGAALTSKNGNVTQTAKELGLERQALQQVMRRYGIKSKDFHDKR